MTAQASACPELKIAMRGGHRRNCKSVDSQYCGKAHTAIAIGFYAGFQSIFTMLASARAGLIWFRFGPSVTFFMTGTATVLVIGYFLVAIKHPANKPT
ncbi:MAG: MFS transporter [Chlorobiales bacterium]|nr:MFS transporter [Chlorobiales bacterium]